MKPLRLTLQGFLSYRDETSFDFTSRPLWMLSGPNGAGKSSVFDAITFALFASHRAGDGQNVKDILNRKCDRLKVAFEFEARGEQYRAERTAARPARSGGTFATSRLLSKRHGATWIGEPETESEAGFKVAIERILGMTVKTFTSSVLLRQGKAEVLLDANPSERLKVLSEIVDLSAYQDLHRRSKERQESYGREAERLKRERNAIPDVGQTEIDEAIAAANEAGGKAEDAVRRKGELIELGVHAARWEKLISDTKQLQTKLASAEALLTDADVIRAGDTRFHALDAVIPKLQDWQRALNAQNDAVLSARNYRAQLSAFYGKYAPALKLPALAQESDITPDELSVALRSLDSAFDTTIERRREANHAIGWLEQFDRSRVEAREALGVISAAANLTEPTLWEDISRPFQAERDTANTAVMDASASLASARTSATKASEEYQRCIDAGDEAVCRYCQQAIDPAKRSIQLAALKAEAETAFELVQRTQNTLTAAKKLLQEANGNLDTAQKEYTREVARYNTQKLARERAQAKLDAARNNAVAAVDALPAAYAAHIMAPKLLVVADYEWMQGSYPTPDDLASVRKLGDTLLAAEGAQKDLAAMQSELHTRESAVSEREFAAAEAGERVPADWRTERDNLIKLQVEWQELKIAPQKLKELEAAERECAGFRDQLARMGGEIEELPERARQPVVAIKEEQNRAEIDEQQAREAFRQAESSASALEQRLNKIVELVSAQESAQYNEAVYRTLTGLLGPENLQRHLLRNAEDAIVSGANDWLGQFSAGSLRLEPRPEGQGTRGKDSALDLDCVNLDTAGDAALPLHNLSGSQKFRVAVSLALGIGQFASREHARIRSVIIDEGFGSLDPAGQNEMLDALKTVAGSLERVIVVSHLEAFSDSFQDRFDIRLDDNKSCVCRIRDGVPDSKFAIGNTVVNAGDE